IRDWSVTGVQTCALPILPAQHIAKRHNCFEIIRILLDQPFQMLLRLVSAVKAVEIGGHLDGSVAMQGSTRRNAIVDLDRKLRFRSEERRVGKEVRRPRLS